MMSKKIQRGAAWLAIAATALVLGACSKPGTAPATNGVTVYSGGDILTMAGREPAYAEALAVRDGKITRRPSAA